MNEKIRKLLAFLGLVEEDVTPYQAAPVRRHEESIPEWEAPIQQRQPLRAAATPPPLARPSTSITLLDANGDAVRPRPVAPVTRGSMHVTSELDIEIFAPRSFNEARRVTDQLKVSKAIVLNVMPIDASLRRRYIDFTSGTAYALDADIETLEKGSVYLIHPRGMTISPEVRARLRAHRYDIVLD